MDQQTGSESSRQELPSGATRSLKGVILLKDQPRATVNKLRKVARWYRYSKGEPIFDRGDTRRDVYFIIEGCVRVVDHAPSGQEVAFIDLKAGEHFGELSALDGEPRSATVYAVEDSVLAEVPAEEFATFLRAHPDVALRMLFALGGFVRRLNERVMSLSCLTDVQRVYGELLQMAEPDPTNPRRWVIHIMPKHKEIAVWADTTPETVASAVGKLLEAEVVRRRQKSLYILDRSRLQEFATAS